ncbi:MAG TPA: triose-phosphate isomerase, partial [Candidatus Paceibacterota bacterium]|nr:triose-phosphate isomerase [Candidatus Paceibacterota bacterium]
MAKKRLVVGNWKMYIEKPEEARQFALTLRRKVRGLSGVDVYVAPPFPFIADVAKVLESSPVRVGAQTCSPYTDGQHTGEITAAMIKNVGGLFSIVGHSERRQEGDTNEIVRIELERAIAANLTPILCIGEEERKKDGEHFAIIEEQLSTAIKDLPKNMLRKLIVAYEPVWAIGKS